jgi:predicted acyltransferase (DUF342 family)
MRMTALNNQIVGKKLAVPIYSHNGMIYLNAGVTLSENHITGIKKQGQKNLIVKNHTVIVPKGEVVKGDVVVQNGKLRIEGEVKGNVTVINGTKYLASAGHVTGDIKEVNQVFDWIWYYFKKTGKDIIHIFYGNKTD